MDPNQVLKWSVLTIVTAYGLRILWRDRYVLAWSSLPADLHRRLFPVEKHSHTNVVLRDGTSIPVDCGPMETVVKWLDMIGATPVDSCSGYPRSWSHPWGSLPYIMFTAHSEIALQMLWAAVLSKGNHMGDEKNPAMWVNLATSGGFGWKMYWGNSRELKQFSDYLIVENHISAAMDVSEDDVVQLGVG